MLLDALALPADRILRADVCVIGGGPAGITAARRLAERKLSVCLLESGGFEREPETQALAAGRTDGNVPRLTPAYLTDTRPRYFGGASNAWAGQCRPLDAVDFVARDWIPHSGWPFERGELDPYYRQAADVLGLNADGFLDGKAPVPADGGQRLFTAANPTVVAKGFQYAALRFGLEFRQELVDSEAIQLVLHGTVVALETNRAGTAVQRARVASASGRGLAVEARWFVLAAGGIENARLLLLSDGTQRAGLGNGNDLVGRYFMEHPHVYDGLGLVAVWRQALGRLYLPGVATMFFTAEPLMRAERLTHLALNLVEARTPALGEADRGLVMAAEDFDMGPRDSGVVRPPSLRQLNVQAEQVPNPASRVTLTSAQDALGARRVNLDWRLAPPDLSSVYRFVHVLCRELAKEGVGRGRVAAAEADLPSLVAWGAHHIGTTRMHADPKHGVVDADARVHGVANLFVAGCSVFPTSGAANPTFTVLALALRLADRIGVLGG